MHEWARYLDMMKSDKSKTLIPCTKDIDAYDIPREFNNLQALDMGKIGWKQDLIRGIKKLTAKDGKPQNEFSKTIIGTGTNIENLMKRIRLFLEDGAFSEATEYVEKVLDANAEYAPAYVAKVCISLKLNKEEDLAKAPFIYEENADWRKALRFATAQQKVLYEDYTSSTIVGLVKKSLLDNLTVEQCKRSIAQLEKYSEYEKVNQQIEEIKATQEELQRRLEEEENRRAEEQKRIRDEQIRKQLARLSDAQKAIRLHKEDFESKKKEYILIQEQIKDRNAAYNAKKREIEKQMDLSKERTKRLLNEELHSNGRLPGRRKNEIVRLRKEEECIQDKLNRQLIDEERKHCNELIEMTTTIPDENELICTIAEIYYKYELYTEALEEYRKIPNYHNVSNLLTNDQHLLEAAKKANAEKQLDYSDIMRSQK